MKPMHLRRISAATSVALLLIAGTLRTLASEIATAEPALAVKAKSAKYPVRLAGIVGNRVAPNQDGSGGNGPRAR